MAQRRSWKKLSVIPLWQGINPADNVSKWCWFRQTSSRKNPTMEICLLHALWSDFWSTISVTRVTETGVHSWRQCESLRSPAEALQLVSISVVCSLFAHPMFPSENCHIQAHGWSSYGGRLQPFHVWVLLPIRGSRPPSDLLTRTMRFAKSAGLCID